MCGLRVRVRVRVKERGGANAQPRLERAKHGVRNLGGLCVRVQWYAQSEKSSNTT